MATSDPIADLLVRIRNGGTAEHKYVDVPLSKLKLAILERLQEEGYIIRYIVNEEKRLIRVYLKYNKDRKARIQILRRLSSPGRRIYVTADQIPYVKSGFGDVIISTSKGIMTGRNARQSKLGGELICSVA